MRLSQVTPAVVIGTWVERSSSLSDRPCIADLASMVVDGLYEKLEESLVMARAFLTVPYQVLPERQRRFAAGLARSVQLESLLGPHTPVHSLLATRGCVPEWNDPRASHGHVAIPLLSDAFVSSIPMMSRLLKELGLPLSWVQDPGSVMEGQMIGSEVGVFFVADPINAVDELGRKIIPAQEFVARHSVRSVFAVGGVVFGGAVLVLIFFGRDSIESRAARAFMPLINQVKGTLVSRCSMSRIFRPDDLSHRENGAAFVPPEVVPAPSRSTE
jgi:hypothetical protein